MPKDPRTGCLCACHRGLRVWGCADPCDHERPTNQADQLLKDCLHHDWTSCSLNPIDCSVIARLEAAVHGGIS